MTAERGHLHCDIRLFVVCFTKCLLAFFLIVCLISYAAGRDHGSGREASYPFSNPGIKEKGDRGHGGRVGQQEISSHAPQTAGRQGEPAQVCKIY